MLAVSIVSDYMLQRNFKSLIREGHLAKVKLLVGDRFEFAACHLHALSTNILLGYEDSKCASVADMQNHAHERLHLAANYPDPSGYSASCANRFLEKLEIEPTSSQVERGGVSAIGCPKNVCPSGCHFEHCPSSMFYGGAFDPVAFNRNGGRCEVRDAQVRRNTNLADSLFWRFVPNDVPAFSIKQDKGAEFRSQVMDEWAYGSGVWLQLIEPGKPIQNAFA